ncbi:hypothetical protein ACFQ08_00815 [Streptosporangium algeriense]|uniref:Uncharacterized protein n=1 Tax=Streptosporangium algeriense TaxID=1682748 RepID=A0ABW3DIT8_9ACTN
MTHPKPPANSPGRLLSRGGVLFTESGEAQTMRDAYDARLRVERGLPVLAPTGKRGGKK